MRQARVRFTYNDYILLPEDKRYEILDGDIYVVAAPNIRHQSVALKLEVALFQHMKETGLGRILHAPCDVILSEANVVQPDILFVHEEHAGIIGELNLQGPPDIVIEILSEGTRRMDLEIKKKIYAQFGIPEYWIVDPEANTIEVLLWCERGYITAGVYSKQDSLSSPALPDFKLALTEIF